MLKRQNRSAVRPRVIAKQGGRQPEQPIDQRRLKPVFREALEPQHRHPLHDLQAGDGERSFVMERTRGHAPRRKRGRAGRS